MFTRDKKTQQRRTHMLKTFAPIVAFVILILLVAAGIAASSSNSRVERGKYLVSIIGCNDCHTPLKMGPRGPEPDMSRFLSGHPEQMGALPTVAPRGPWLWAGAATNTAFSGPWGISYP